MLMQTLQNILPNLNFYFDAAPLFILLIAGLMTMLVGVFSSSPTQPSKAAFVIAIVALIASLFLAFMPIRGGTFFNGSVLLDSITSVSFCVISLGSLFTLICTSATKLGKNFLRSELTTLLLFSSAGLMIISMSGDLLSFFIGLEITSICLYVLVGYLKPNFEFETHRQDISRLKSLEASIKYFLLGSGASAVMLMGTALIYAALGNVNFESFYNLNFSNPFTLFGVVLLLIGLAFKLGMAPFHSWVPDVYEGANSHLTGYMASLVKFSLVMVLMRIVSSFGHGSTLLPILFGILGVASIVVGSLFGLVQNSVKRMLAYSSVANVGYFCLAFAVLAKDPTSLTAKQALFIYAFIYTFLSLGAFNVLAWFEDGNRDDLFKEELSGIGQSKPFSAFALSVFLFGLAGIPPLAGFFGKLVLLITAVQNGFLWFAFVLVIFSCFSLYYYLNLMVDMWFRTPTRYTVFAKQPRHTNVVMSVMSVFAMIIIFAIGLFGI